MNVLYQAVGRVLFGLKGKMASYFDVSLDYLLTGISAENIDLNKKLGLSEEAVKQLELVHDFGADAQATDVFPLLNELLSDMEFYSLLADLINRKEIINELQMLTVEEKNKKYGALDIDGYYAWDMRKYIEDFISKQLAKHGINPLDK